VGINIRYLVEAKTTKFDDNLASGSQKDVGKMHLFQDQVVCTLDYNQAVYFNCHKVVHSETEDEFIV